MLHVVKKWQLYTVSLMGLMVLTSADARTYRYTYYAHGPQGSVKVKVRYKEYHRRCHRCHRCHRCYRRTYCVPRHRHWFWFGLGFGFGSPRPYYVPTNYGGGQPNQPGQPPQTPPPGHHHREGGGVTPIDATRGQKALIEAVRAVGGKSVEGQYDPGICQLTEAYAQSMAQKGGIDGHAGFGQRSQQIGGATSEIIAENSGFGNSLEAAAQQCVQSWVQSPGHNQHMMSYQSRYCYSMAQSANGKFLCVGLFSK